MAAILRLHLLITVLHLLKQTIKGHSVMLALTYFVLNLFCKYPESVYLMDFVDSYVFELL